MTTSLINEPLQNPAGKSAVLVVEDDPIQASMRQIPAIMNRDAVRIDTTGRRGWVDQTELSLRPKQFGLLPTLAIDAGRVFSHPLLLETIWGKGVIVDKQTVAVHISWLRRKLRGTGLVPDPIQTSHCSGYRFSAGLASAPIPLQELLRQGGEEIQVGRSAHLAIRQPKENCL